jgi:hypothetical protein
LSSVITARNHAQYFLYGHVKASIFTCAAVRLGCPTFCETSLVIVQP